MAEPTPKAARLDAIAVDRRWAFRNCPAEINEERSRVVPPAEALEGARQV